VRKSTTPNWSKKQIKKNKYPSDRNPETSPGPNRKFPWDIQGVAEKFARDSNSEAGQIRMARQGFFSITNRNARTPQIKKISVVTKIDCQLED
jgi:hypothetical protein